MNTEKKQPKATERPATINLAAEITAAVQTDDTPEIERVLMESDNMLTIDGRPYELVANYHDGFDKDKLAARFSDILTKYDYIVGDWGYEQLRLKGFYAENNKRAHRDQLITTLEDYLYEYCNFGCAYFVLQRLGTPKRDNSTGNSSKRRRTRSPRRRQQAHTSERREQADPLKRKNVRAETNNKSPRKRHFTIRKQKATKPTKKVH